MLNTDSVRVSNLDDDIFELSVVLYGTEREEQRYTHDKTLYNKKKSFEL